MAPELKTPAFIQYIGNDVGGQLNIQLSKIGLTASSTGPLVPAMKSGMPSTKGTLLYTSINQLKSGPCMVTADFDNGRVTMIFTQQTTVVGVLSAQGGTFTSAFGPTLVNVQFTSSQSRLDTKDLLVAIEKLGGYDGYQQYLSQSPSEKANALARVSNVDDSEWNRISATLRMGPSQFPNLPCNWFVVDTADDHSGIGAFWTEPIDEKFLHGVEFRYGSWKELCAAQNTWFIDAGSDGPGTFAVHFTQGITGKEVATLHVSGVPDEVVAKVIGASGYVDWSLPVTTNEGKEVAPLEDDTKSEVQS